MTGSDRCARKSCLPGDPCEACFRGQVVQLARLQGWAVYHGADTADAKKNRDSDPGFPDLVLVRDEEMFCVETKTLKGRLRPGQAEWITALNRVRLVSACVVRPHMWEAIERMLARD